MLSPCAHLCAHACPACDGATRSCDAADAVVDVASTRALREALVDFNARIRLRAHLDLTQDDGLASTDAAGVREAVAVLVAAGRRVAITVRPASGRHR